MTVVSLVVGAVILASASGWLVDTEPFGRAFFLGVVTLYLLGTFIILKRIVAYHPYPRFGAANTVTLARFVLACLFAGLALQVAITESPPPAFQWGFFALAVLERMLDGIDGHLARRQRMESPFGSRFDMEVDALQILLLSVIAFEFGKAGAWVLAGGALRYVFLAAGALWPCMLQPLPPSIGRKIIAVVQGGTLAALLMPNFGPPLSEVAAAIALVLLAYSFAIDTLWLVRSRPLTRL